MFIYYYTEKNIYVYLYQKVSFKKQFNEGCKDCIVTKGKSILLYMYYIIFNN